MTWLHALWSFPSLFFPSSTIKLCCWRFVCNASAKPEIRPVEIEDLWVSIGDTQVWIPHLLGMRPARLPGWCLSCPNNTAVSHEKLYLHEQATFGREIIVMKSLMSARVFHSKWMFQGPKMVPKTAASQQAFQRCTMMDQASGLVMVTVLSSHPAVTNSMALCAAVALRLRCGCAVVALWLLLEIIATATVG